MLLCNCIGKVGKERGGDDFRLHQGIGEVLFWTRISQLFDKTQAELGVCLRIAELWSFFYFLCVPSKTLVDNTVRELF